LPEALGLRVETQYLVDRKKAARQFQQICHAGNFAHQYKEFRAVQTGACELHPKGDCTFGSIDLAVQGLPCQPFTDQRHKGGQSSRTGDARGHDDFKTVFSTFFEFLDGESKPKGWVVEEVESFRRLTDPVAGLKYLDSFIDLCEERGFFVRPLLLDASIYSDVPRTRLYIIGVNQELGGKKGIAWITKAVEDPFLC
jgi:site-specific DNA-cytosine methylase